MSIDEIVAQMEPATAELGFLDSLGEAATCSIAISLKRIADSFDSSDQGGKPQGSVLWWMEMMASAANAGRS